MPGSKLTTRLRAPFAAIVLIAALAVPAVASAQDPSVDQYTPTAPDGGGSVPTSPVPNSDNGGIGGGPSAPADTSSGGTAETTVPTDPAATTPSDSSSTAPVDPVNTAAGESKNKDERTLEGIAANASQQREDTGAASSDGPATELLRSDSGGGLGMGVVLWVVLGVTALWAIATVVRRRQDQDGHPA